MSNRTAIYLTFGIALVICGLVLGFSSRSPFPLILVFPGIPMVFIALASFKKSKP